ncbi:MAG: PBP1A family penicillin-binding protein [Alphaproteobacteria bacterium]|nr:PBP1A family penicillin-binding protein [Alphaproteobacteria bacterium]
MLGRYRARSDMSRRAMDEEKNKQREARSDAAKAAGEAARAGRAAVRAAARAALAAAQDLASAAAGALGGLAERLRARRGAAGLSEPQRAAADAKGDLGDAPAETAPRRGLFEKARGRNESAAGFSSPARGGDVRAADGGGDGGAGESRPRSLRRTAAIELFSVGGSLAFAGAIAFLFVAFVLIAPRPEKGADLWAVNRQPSITILDRNGKEIASRGARYGQAVAVSDLPPYLVKAFIATEDRRFYEHHGVDFRGTLRAALANFKAGHVVEGGSTITQQLARNLFLTFKQTYSRKAKEALLALWIEGRYSKDQILSLYLNRIYLGAGAYGVEAAAETYFGKSARKVSLAEAVMLAGLPQAPSAYAPTQNPKAAERRAEQVLENLRETGAVTEFEARQAREHPPVIANANDEADIGWFFDYVAAKARDLVGGRPGDLIITTTIDPKMQKAAETAVRSVIGVDAQTAGAEQAALICYDVDGAMRAMVGGRSYLESQFNRATMARRQPGSAFKPFVYVAGMEAGLTPESVFVDQPIDINGWKPTNYEPGYQGPMRLSEALAKSINTIAVQVSQYVGLGKVIDAAKRMGVTSPLPEVPSLALGGVSLSLQELTEAYLPFADNGLKPQAYAIERIEDQNYEVVYQHADKPAPRVLSPHVSEEMNTLLFQVMNSGTGRGANLGDRVAAGKTGTTNDWRDAWFIGYTAQLVAGVWVGNDDFHPMDKVTGGRLPARIWKEFMTAASRGMPEKPIPGAYPTSTYADQSALLDFYTDVLNGLQKVRRDGDPRRRWF